MDLIASIINELIDLNISVASPLYKTKVLASRLRNQELQDWVDSELNGYKDLESVPDYRKCTAHISGTVRNGYTIYRDIAISTSGLPETFCTLIHSMNFDQSVATLESYLVNNTSGVIQAVFSAEITGALESNMRKLGNPFFEIITARKSISSNYVTQILSVIRSKLLDFMLKVDNEFGNLTEIELKAKNNLITNIMYNTINNNGDGNINNTGNAASINATIKINKGNKEQLQKQLLDSGIVDIDVKELIDIIDTENFDNDKASFGNKVNLWIQKMIGKALDGTWQIGIGAAGGFLAEVIKGYYGAA